MSTNIRYELDALVLRQDTISVAEVLCDVLHEVDVSTHFIAIDLIGVTPDAVGDAATLGQVLVQILHNAMGRAPFDSTIRLTPVYDAQTVGLSFTDEGPELSAESLAELVVAKTLVEAMGGTVSAEPAGGCGTTIEVRLMRSRRTLPN